MLPFILAALALSRQAEARGTSGQFWAGYAIGCGLLLLGPAALFLLAAVRGARMMQVTIGFGPVVRRWMGADRVIILRTVPLSVSGGFLPRRDRHFEDFVLIRCGYLLAPLAGALILTLVLPSAAILPMLLVVGFWMVMAALALSRAAGVRGSGRTRDQQAIDRIHATVALVFGDLDTAEALRPAYAPQTAVVRGDYAGALRLIGDPSAFKSPLERANYTRILLLDAEAHPEKTEAALAYADAFLASMMNVASDPDYAPMLALYRLAKAEPDNAMGSVHRAMNHGANPLSLADALCNRARIEAARDRLDQAGRSLRQARSFAPWYARVAIVRGLIGADHGAAIAAMPAPAPAPAPPAPGEDTPHDPWAVPRG